jgi:hypothetical protein
MASTSGVGFGVSKRFDGVSTDANRPELTDPAVYPEKQMSYPLRGGLNILMHDAVASRSIEGSVVEGYAVWSAVAVDMGACSTHPACLDHLFSAWMWRQSRE